MSKRAYIADRDGTVTQSGGTGGSSLNWLTGETVASGGIVSGLVGVPGLGSLRLYHAQGQRINLYLNSNAPATQNVTVGTGSIAVSAIGTGYTLTTSAGTATISGQGAVTMGTTQVITVTGAGTIAFTVTGTPVGACVNVEQNTFAGIKLITAGASVTRTADNLLWTPPAALSTTQGELYAFAVPYGWSVAAATQHPNGVNAYMVRSITASNSSLLKDTLDDKAIKDDAGTQAAAASAIAQSSGTMRVFSQKYDASALRLYRGDTLAASDSTLSAPWGGVSAFYIGSQFTPADHWFGAVGLIYDPTPSDATRAAVARALNGYVVPVRA